MGHIAPGGAALKDNGATASGADNSQKTPCDASRAKKEDVKKETDPKKAAETAAKELEKAEVTLELTGEKDVAAAAELTTKAAIEGKNVEQLAGELGLTVESARTYSKRIYAKTAARGQADLVRFIHRSVLAIA